MDRSSSDRESLSEMFFNIIIFVKSIFLIDDEYLFTKEFEETEKERRKKNRGYVSFFNF